MAGFSVRTDIASELTEQLEKLEGVSTSTEKLDGGILLTRGNVLDERGERATGKPRGRYVTIESDGLKARSRKAAENAAQVLSRELAALCPEISGTGTALVVGLGNAGVTPDALGPETVDRIAVTRHLTEYMPKAAAEEKLRPVCAIAPGVLGVTGLETGEVIRGVVEKVKPAVVIAVDALASRSTDRLNSTIQLTDTGIRPGGGLGGRRMELTRETLGVSVVALGMPTVVHAGTITRDAVELFLLRMGEKENSALLEMVADAFEERFGSLVVTPKDIDALIDDGARLIAMGLDSALHGAGLETVRRVLEN